MYLCPECGTRATVEMVRRFNTHAARRYQCPKASCRARFSTREHVEGNGRGKLPPKQISVNNALGLSDDVSLADVVGT